MHASLRQNWMSSSLKMTQLITRGAGMARSSCLVLLLLSVAAVLCSRSPPSQPSMHALPTKLDLPAVVSVYWSNVPSFQNDDYIGVTLLTNSTGIIVTTTWYLLCDK